ncbi:MAG: 6-phospho-3-hexuloisomerase [Bacilli bacterium]
MNEADAIVREIDSVLRSLREEEIDLFVQRIATAERVFVVGEGRTGFVMKSFAMRLMHMGMCVFVAGETITPAMRAGDLLIAGSGSGSTQSVLHVVRTAATGGAHVVAATAHPESPLGELAETALHIAAATKGRLSGETVSAQPLGSLFDQCLHVALDAVCMRLMLTLHERSENLLERHANIE